MSLIKTLFSNSLFKTTVGHAGFGVRTLKSAVNIKWVRPVKKPFMHPLNSGDSQKITNYEKTKILREFEHSEELATADENVKSIFRIEMNNMFSKYYMYKKELGDRVRRHQYDTRSHEIYIANLTAKIRFLQEHMEKNPKDTRRKVKLQHLIDRRKSQLTHLRRWDYKRFEWILEKLELVYRPYPDIYDRVARKKSLLLLTDLHCEELKEKKVAEYRKQMDAKKISFLEEKLEKLKWIQEQETEFKMQPTVTDEDIADCQRKLELVRVELESKTNKNYVRTVDPYTLEIYDLQALQEAEKQSISD